ncbi:MAG: hypothetical protein DWQ05_22435 [Calditrichaeota bacterium]|nr:MAG: hypothetical protein DWQ05_22435 [Calditrichota bacterium]
MKCVFLAYYLLVSKKKQCWIADFEKNKIGKILMLMTSVKLSKLRLKQRQIFAENRASSWQWSQRDGEFNQKID